MHYTVKMVRKADGLVRDERTEYAPDAATALADFSETMLGSFDWEGSDWRENWTFTVEEDPQAEAEYNEFLDRKVKETVEFYKRTGRYPE